VDVQLQERGYLFLARTKQEQNNMMNNHGVQQKAGCQNDIQLLTSQQLQNEFPWLNVNDVLLGSLGRSGGGWFDPWPYLRGLKQKCLELGVTYLHGKPVGATRDEVTGSISSVDLQLLGNHKKTLSTNNIQRRNVQFVVNAAGAHSGTLMNLLASSSSGTLLHSLPVVPRKRCIFFFHCSSSDGAIVPYDAPLTICPTTNVYFRSDGPPGSAHFLCGVSPTPEHDIDSYNEDDLNRVDYHLFDDIIWPALYHLVPAFGTIKVKSSWAGYYEYNVVDQNGIIDFHPDMGNVLMVCGFTGHGLQHSPAAGRAAAELLEFGQGQFQTLDLSILGFDRLIEKDGRNGTNIFEQGIV